MTISATEAKKEVTTEAKAEAKGMHAVKGGKTPEVIYKKKTAPIVKFKEGMTVEGYFITKQKIRDEGDRENIETGEVKRVKALNAYLFQKPNDGERFRIFENAGLKNGFDMAQVSEKELVKLVHMGLQEIGEGRRVNVIDVYTTGVYLQE